MFGIEKILRVFFERLKKLFFNETTQDSEYCELDEDFDLDDLRVSTTEVSYNIISCDDLLHDCEVCQILFHFDEGSSFVRYMNALKNCLKIELQICQDIYENIKDKQKYKVLTAALQKISKSKQKYATYLRTRLANVLGVPSAVFA